MVQLDMRPARSSQSKYGVAGIDPSAVLLPGVNLDFDTIEMNKYGVAVLNLRAPSVLLGFKVGGILGHKFLAGYRVSLSISTARNCACRSSDVRAMRASHHRFLIVIGLLALVAQPTNAQRARGPAPDGPPERVDYLAFAQGAVPVAIGGAGARLGANFESAVTITDGDPTAFTVVSGATAETDTEFTFELPALTTFDRFAVPNIVETPSPTTTFTRLVEVHGSATSPTAGLVLLASATLATHKTRGLVTELAVVSRQPVRWIKLRLVGGINVMQPKSWLEFSEIVGNGAQETPTLATTFQGAWRMGRKPRSVDPARAHRLGLLRRNRRPRGHGHGQHLARHGSRSERQDAECVHSERGIGWIAARRAVDEPRPVPPLHRGGRAGRH